MSSSQLQSSALLQQHSCDLTPEAQGWDDQTNKIAPGLMARVVTIIEGERIETDRNFVGDDVCCVELGLGCEIIGADIFPTDD